ncbi:MAG: GAF domain-containing protein [Lentilitoribacter sp.]
MTNFHEILSQVDQPMTTFKALEHLVDQTIGVKLFTLMEIDTKKGVARRTYSNMPEAYPSSGEKPIQDNAWTTKVQVHHETFVANSIDEIAEVFGDYELIQSLGCESCLNLPIIVNGEAIGTLNCLHDAGRYTPERVAAAQELKQAGAMAFLLAASLKEGN